jgi:hypothetical protein
MRKTARAFGTGALLFAIFLIGSYLYLSWSLRHMKIDAFAAIFQKIFAPVEVLGAVVGAHENCTGAVDLSSLGNQESEAEMSFVATMPSLYKERFGSVPSSITDLRRLPEFERPDSLNGHAFLRDCSIYADPDGSFAVSCGRFRPSAPDVAAFMKDTPPVQKFSTLGKSEILYVPAPRC